MRTLTAGSHVDTLKHRLPWPVAAPLKGVIKGYRQLTAGHRVLPDFLVIGSRKCGTSSLYQYLSEHPSVLPAMSKEIFYFGDFYNRGERWYRRHFPLAAERRFWAWRRGSPVLTGEATPNYFNNPDAPDRIRAMNPAVKLVAIFRDPVMAAYSAYQFGIAKGIYTAAGHPFRKIVEAELAQLRDDPTSVDCQTMLLPRYVYADHLSRWYAVFPRDQIRVMCLEWFAADPQAQFDGLTDFLGLQRSRAVSFQPHNANDYRGMDNDLRDRLRDFYRPHNARLTTLCGQRFPWSSDDDSALLSITGTEVDSSDSGDN